jgi:hypothetical protein
MGRRKIPVSPSKVLKARITVAKADQSAKRAKAVKTAQAKAAKALKQSSKEDVSPSDPNAEPTSKAVTLGWG